MTHDESQEAEPVPRGLGLATLPRRFLLFYTFLYMLPFPLDMLGVVTAIPGLESSGLASALQWIAGLHAKLTGPIVQALGQWLTGQVISLEQTGSGDGLAGYFDVLVDGGLALFLALAWWAWRRATPVSAGVAELNRVFLRYYLFTAMVGYGLVKLIPGGQFPPLGPDRLVVPYGDSSPMGLLWNFMGASAGYQMFCGAAEVAGGVLLLFRRTTLLGSLVTAAAMANVFVLNLCYDVPVKLYSFHLLFFALVLAAPDGGRLLALFVTNKPVPARDQGVFCASSPKLRRACLVVKALFVPLFFAQMIGGTVSYLQGRQEALENPLRGVYQVESYVVVNPQSSGTDAKDWLRVGLTPSSSLTILRADGSTSRLRMRLDMENSKLKLYERGAPEPDEYALQFALSDENQLQIEGEFEGRQIVVQLRRDDRESLLNSRGFHWINETPFNR
ncbi:MAG: hypothetical protein AB7S38_35135 [Vulcanimicrobiota bacterium]